MKRGLAVAGLVVLLAGLVLGFVPLSKNGVSCGSALRASDDARIEDITRTLGGGPADGLPGGALPDGLQGLSPYEDACDDRRGIYQPIVWVLIAVGAGLLLAAAVVPGTKSAPDAPVGPSA